ncbi:MAG: hypothetical protein R3308_05790, partial [Thiohalobacterales bacterium]|nr:hypothetical protein [Thiohalobacterales bacterium]
LVQFAQRITVDYHLEPLSEGETAGYIRHRMQVAGGNPATFTVDACKAVHRYSNGVPRLINLLCDTALVYGYAEQARQIDDRLITDVAREKQQSGIFPIFAVATRDAAAQPAPAAPGADETPSPADTDEAAPPAHRPGPVSIELAASTPEASVAAQVDPADDEYRWMHGHKKRLRIALFSPEEDLRRYLSRLLEAYSHRVIVSEPLETATLAELDMADVDVVLIDRDTSHPLPADATGIISGWDRPVLYNDSTITARNLREGNPDFGLELSARIQALMDRFNAGIAAV